MKLIQTIVLVVLLPMTCDFLWAQNRIAFATSVTGSADLSSWPEADGNTGLDAGDAICVKLATVASLANPDNFVAWLSDVDDDAYCRVQGFTGKRSANCGKAQLPVNAGPWERKDGVPAAGSLSELEAVGSMIVIFTPLRTDEFDQTVANGQAAWSSSSSAGTYIPGNTCGDWSSSVGNGLGALLSTSGWDSFSGAACNVTTRHLICVEKFAGPSLVIPEPQGNIAFLTDTDGNGNLASWPEADIGASGIAAADSICNNIADANGMPWPGTYKAWLSDSSVEARDRFSGVGPWHRLDGIKVAESATDLASGSLLAPINFTDQGRYIRNWGVWTGSNANGTRNTDRCSDWTADSGTGRSGRAFFADNQWTDMDTIPCDSDLMRLYCLSDSDLSVFGDGFESE
jgi:hypothetical protein